MNAQLDFAANPHPHPREHVERVGHAAVGRVLDGHQAEIGLLAMNFLEDGGDAADGHELNALAEAMDGGQVAETVERPQECNPRLANQPPAAAGHLAQQRLHTGLRQRDLARRCRQSLLRLSIERRRTEGLGLRRVLPGGLHHEPGPLFGESDQIFVEPADLGQEGLGQSRGGFAPRARRVGRFRFRLAHACSHTIF